MRTDTAAGVLGRVGGAGCVGGSGVSAAELREAMGHFATGVTVVTSVDADGQPVGTTANAVTSLSLDPPLVLVCFDLGSLTLRAIRGHGAFVVNVLAAPQQHLSRNFARRGFAAAWDGVRHRRGADREPPARGRARGAGVHGGARAARRRPRDHRRPRPARRDQFHPRRPAGLLPRYVCLPPQTSPCSPPGSRFFPVPG